MVIEKTNWTLEYISTLAPRQIRVFLAASNSLTKKLKDKPGVTGSDLPKSVSANTGAIIKELTHLPGGITKVKKVKKKVPKPKKA